MNTKKHVLLTTAFMVAAFFFSACGDDGKTITDARDGKKYKITTIGNQVWMAENLNYEMNGSWCYNDEPNNCKVYGRLYSYQAAQKACPTGWHLPNATEWQILADYVGDGENIDKLKTKLGWGFDDVEKKSLNGSDEFDFSVLPGGYRYNGEFVDEGRCAGFWEYTDKTMGEPFIFGILIVFDVDELHKKNADSFSIRCIKD